MTNYINNIYAAFIVSFILLLSSIILSYQNIQKSNAILESLSKDQTKLNYFTNKLNYDIQKNQAEILQLAQLKKSFTSEQEEKAYKAIQHSIEKLQEFLLENPSLPIEFSQTLHVIANRTIAFKIVQHSLIDAIAIKNQEDIEDALIGFNSIAKEFDKDTDILINLANAQLYKNVLNLTSNNNKSSESLIFSFLIAVILIGFSAYKFNALHTKLQKQLRRAQNAEDSLQKMQKKLLLYNDDLEAEIERKTRELHNKIYTHSLTSLPNRNRLLEDISTHDFSYMAILNIDKFQSFNDLYGEETGNIALIMSAQFLQNSIKDKPMFLYHLSGDEFVILSKDNTALTHQLFTEEIEYILKSFKSEQFTHEKQSFQFMMSSGLAFGGKKKILAHADMALKDAKKRNIQLSIYSDENELEKSHKEDMECRQKLLYAIESKNVFSYFQPIVPIQSSSENIRYESLVRLKDEDGKIITPFNFLNVAKVNRIYHKITRIVIDKTLEVVAEHRISCSLNLSLSDIENSKTMEYFYERLDNFEYNELLTVELLETEDFKNYKMVYDFCIKVRSYGVKVALDDFGSGYSNFSHILQLPVDYIKIDASLISNIDRDLSSQIMVETIVELAHKLNVTTIAEFVSSEEILTVIKDIGVDYAQGFHFGKPADIKEHLAHFEKYYI
ncbi:MAG: bifunctional diguanylate cyclase/phosphodiesterase [Campylobacterales bacterium]|nr:bifunctional diguanylate cyclase/phosphodiesterase [Campylobacterales bacterium]